MQPGSELFIIYITILYIEPHLNMSLHE